MALLRRGSSGISEENFNSRLVRERANVGAVTASLAWNDPSDLDLSATVILENGGKEKIDYKNKRAAGGYLDVDMHARDNETVDEPVENIFWKEPPAGVYCIEVNLYKKRGPREDREGVPFRALLKREGDEDLSHEGIVYFDSSSGARSLEVFRFIVGENGQVTPGIVGTPLPAVKPRPAAPVRLSMKAKKATRVMKVAKKVVKMTKRVSRIAKGKHGKKLVWSSKKVKTSGGLTKGDLVKSRRGKIVSKRRSEQGKQNRWSIATKKAHGIKGYVGFKPIKRGNSFYNAIKQIMAQP